MNPQLKEKLDELVKELAVKYKQRTEFVNLLVNVTIITTKVDLFKMFAKSARIDVEESCKLISDDLGNISIIAAALAGIEDVATLMPLVDEMHAKLHPLLTHFYGGPTTATGLTGSH